MSKIKKEVINQQEEKNSKIEKWAFPTVSRCPRCGSTDTICRHTNNKLGRQYRQCQRAICRKNYTVDGKLV